MVVGVGVEFGRARNRGKTGTTRHNPKRAAEHTNAGSDLEKGSSKALLD